MHLLGWYASSTLKGGFDFAHQTLTKKKTERETKCQETITTGAHQGFEGSNAATTDHFAVLHSPTTVTTRLAARLDTVSPTGEEMIVQTSGTVGQSCSYILRLLLQWGIHWSATISIYWYFHLIKDFMSFWNLSNIQYIFSSSAIAKKKHGFQSDCYLPYPKNPQRHLIQFVFVGEQLSWCRGSKRCISDVGILTSSFPNVGRWVKLSRL